jgi:multidrug efflux pump
MSEEKVMNSDQLTKEAAIDRFRAITMTTLSTMTGHIPLILASGAGAVARNSIGTVLVFGAATLYLVSIFVYPCFIKFFLDLKIRRKPLSALENSR